MRHRRKVRQADRAGFSLLELLIVLGILSLLLAILFPAVMRARGNARRITCLNHMRQISLAMLNHVDQQGRFPAAGLFSPVGTTSHHNWVTAILPQLDQSALSQRYELSKPYLDAGNFELTRTPLPLLTCPDDFSTVAGEGNLSYVVNGGVGWTIPIDCPASAQNEGDRVSIGPLDLNGNGVVCPFENEPGPGPSDLSFLQDLNLFFVENWPQKSGTERFHRLRDLVDGTTTTVMLAENIRAGFDPESPSS